MKLKKKYVLIVILSLSIWFYFYSKMYNTSHSHLIHWISQDTNTKFISKETIVNQIIEKEKLITTEIDLKETIVIDNSWGNFMLFKKIQNITFYGKGIYSIDLSTLKPEDIILDSGKNSITLKVPKPTVDMITIDESKTECSEPERGPFRFGDIMISTEENQLVLNYVKEKMKNTMKLKKYSDEAEKNTIKSLKDFIASIIVSDTENSKKFSEINIELQ